MASLITVKGPNPGRRFPLTADITLIGRQPDAGIYLESLAVSRQHARVLWQGGTYHLEDLGSSNGTWMNGFRVNSRVSFTERDEIQIGPYVFHLAVDRSERGAEQVIRARIDAASLGAINTTLYSQNPAYKLQVVLEITQHLGQTLEIDVLLGRLLDQLLRLFPQADRGMVLLCERDQLIVRAQRTRSQGTGDYPYSRSIVRRALEEGVGLLSEDVPHDQALQLTATLVSLNLRSFLCVPLMGGRELRRLGVVQLDCLRQGASFRAEDLEVLTTVCIQVSLVLQNAAFHAERLREERLRQELMLARDIQQCFLPSQFDIFPERRSELFARVHPAREVAGDLYDFFRLPDDRLVLFLGDVSGKGIPAALFMIAVRTLSRQVAPLASGPGDLLVRLDRALKADNPTNLYVTLLCGFYDDKTGKLTLATGAHPRPLLCRADGEVKEIELKPAMMLGCAPVDLRVTEYTLELQPEDVVVAYTDGFTEARDSEQQEFGVERLSEVVVAHRHLSLRECAAIAVQKVQDFTGQKELQDDQTLLLLRKS